jgi:hypothetical protein
MMEIISSGLAIFTGLLVRLAIPLLLTALLIFLLRRLDARWQKEAQIPELVVPKPRCWKIKGCPPEQVRNCPGARSNLPCWQAFRLPNGYLGEDCLTCKVFTEAPMPALKIETRRM